MPDTDPNHENEMADIMHSQSQENRHCDYTDTEILEYILTMHRATRAQIVAKMQRESQSRAKQNLLADFYRYRDQYDPASYRRRPIDEHYEVFKSWNRSGIPVSKQELADYFQSRVL